MRDRDIQFLFHFIRRPAMYTGSNKKNDFKQINNFLLAYELGSNFECDFRGRLIRQMEAKYGVHMPSEGFAKQLRLAAKKAKKEVGAFFLDECMEILVEASDRDNRNIFMSLSRKELVKQLEVFPAQINIYWVSTFDKQLKELQAWRGVSLWEEEMELCLSLIEDIYKLIRMDNLMAYKEVPKEIMNKRDRLLAILKAALV